MIVLHHSEGHFGFPRHFWERFTLDQAVSFFFILSGFILAYVYPTLDTLGRRRFLLARFARIYPAHLAALCLVFISGLYPLRFTPTGTPQMLVAQLALVQAWIPIQRYTTAFNGPSWSISTEFAFYLCFLLLIPNWRRTWHVKLGGALLIVVAMVAIGTALQAMVAIGTALHLPVTVADTSNTVGLASLLYFHPLARLFEFALGMATALAWPALAPRIHLGLWGGTLLECGAVALAFAAMYFTQSVVVASIHLTGVGSGVWFAHGGATCLAFASLILVMALGRGLLSRWLAFPLLVLLGEISYTVYLIHQILIITDEHHARAFAAIPDWAVYLGFWAVTLLLAYIIWAIVERPLRRFIIGLWRWRTAADPMPPRASVEHAARRASERPPAWTTPTGRRIAAAALILALILGTSQYLIAFPPSLSTVDAAVVADVAANGIPAANAVNFGGEFLLQGAKMERVDGGIRLELIWQSLAAERLDWLIAVHCVDASGRLIAQADYPQDSAQSKARKGAIWRDVTEIPQTKLIAPVSAIAIALCRPSGSLLTVDRGPRDWDNHRLLLPLPIRGP